MEKKQNFNKIIVCSDFLATSDTEQLSNLKWLFDVLKSPIKKSTSMELEKFNGDEINGFSRYEFFIKSDIKINLIDLQIDFAPEKINKESLNYLKNFIDKETLIIGYELSLNTRKILEKNGFTYIDLWLHPIRFLDDILFGFNSNNKDIFNKIRDFKYPKDLFKIYADRYKISTYKGFKRIDLNLLPNSALIVGQTMQDKAVLKDGKFLTLLDFEKEIEEITSQYNVVYFSRHPYEKNDKKIVDFMKSFKNVVIIDYPSYQILSQEEIVLVAGVSSSVVIEAEYFDKKTQMFYKPVLNLDEEFSIDSYISIMQDFIYPHFWSSILENVFETNKIDKVSFLEKKDKLRDMLGFYWSYKSVDKIEMIRNEVNDLSSRIRRLDNKVNNSSNKKKPIFYKRSSMYKTIIKNESQIWDEIVKEIDSVKVVSFDVFDTLLTRPLEFPNDLFDYMDSYFKDITEGKINLSFRQIRQKARGWVKDGNCGEEVSLKERYDAISEELNIPKYKTDLLHDLELKLELLILRRREFVFKIFEYAKSKGKKIVILSDTFFESDFIKEALDKNNIAGYDLLWVSSETKLLKHTGNIYPKLVEELNVLPEDILHIGDNKNADIDMAEKNGLKTLYIPRTIDHFKNKAGLSKALEISNSPFNNSMIKGIVGNKVMDNPLTFSYPSHTGGDRYFFGYSIAGPMFYGFSKWLQLKAKEEKVDKLFFLARDGDIIKKSFELLENNSSIEIEYLHVSRRVLSVPSIREEKDIEEIAKANFSAVALKNIIKNRFGIEIDDVPAKIFKSNGFEDKETIVSSKNDAESVLNFCLSIKDKIFKNAEEEREVLLKYLKSKGFNPNKENTWVVDIGHNGSLQRRLNELYKTNKVGGFYFLTHLGIVETILDRGMKAYGYVAEKINPTDKRYPYNRNVLMFEACFLNKEGSMIKFEEVDGEIKKVQKSVLEEKERIDFISKVHAGALDFIKDIEKVSNSLEEDIEIDGRKSINPYMALLNVPYKLDVLLFNKVSFENMYSGRDNTYLIYYDENNEEKSKRLSYWKHGIDSIPWKETKNKKTFAQKNIERIVYSIYKLKLLSPEKYNKFKRNPEEFFLDAKNKKIRKLYKYCGDKNEKRVI